MEGLYIDIKNLHTLSLDRKVQSQCLFRNDGDIVYKVKEDMIHVTNEQEQEQTMKLNTP